MSTRREYTILPTLTVAISQRLHARWISVTTHWSTMTTRHYHHALQLQKTLQNGTLQKR